jgi:hypothetical protein
VVEFYSDENAIAGLIQCPLDENDPTGDHMHPIEHGIHRPPRETLPIAARFHCPRSEIHPNAGRIRATALRMNTIADRIHATRGHFIALRMPFPRGALWIASRRPSLANSYRP